MKPEIPILDDDGNLQQGAVSVHCKKQPHYQHGKYFL